MSRCTSRIGIAVAFLLSSIAPELQGQSSSKAEANWPAPQEGDYVVTRFFHFQSGETLPEMRLH